MIRMSNLKCKYPVVLCRAADKQGAIQIPCHFKGSVDHYNIAHIIREHGPKYTRNNVLALLATLESSQFATAR